MIQPPTSRPTTPDREQGDHPHDERTVPAPRTGQPPTATARSGTEPPDPARSDPAPPASARQVPASPGPTTPNNPDASHDTDQAASGAQRGARPRARATTARPGRARRARREQDVEQLSLPGLDEWVQEQLTHAPPRSREWERRVAAIYGLEIPDE